MPNWVKNKVRFEDKRVIEECYTEENGEENFDFDKIIPMPKSMHLTSGGRETISIIYAISKMSSEKKEEVINKFKETETDFYGNYYNKLLKNIDNYKDTDFEKEDEELRAIIKGNKEERFENIDYKGLGIKNLEDLGNTYINNIIEYGFDTWYDWACENWGTKWGACHTYYVDENNIEFDCAWSVPYNILKEISRKYQTKVEVDFADEDIGSNCGRIVFKNGKEIDYSVGNRDFAYEVWDYTDEEIAECESYYNDDEE